MARNRIFYPNEAVFAGPSPATGVQSGINQLHRVQSANYSFNVGREFVQQFATLAPIDQVITTPPTVSLDVSYYVTNVNNASGMGFSVNRGINFISGMMAGSENDRNYYITIAPAGQDAAGYAGADRAAYGIGNGFVTSFSAEGAVGGFATESVNIEAYNFRGYNVPSGASPAIDPTPSALVAGKTFVLPTAVSGFGGQISAIRPGDIKLDISNINTIGAAANDLKVQNYSISVDLGRTDIQALGSFYPKSKEINVPIPVTMSVSTIVGDINTGDLNQVLCNDAGYDLQVNLLAPACPPNSGSVAVQYTVKGAKLNSHNYGLDVGSNAKTLDLEFSAFVGGPMDQARGLFYSGRFDS
jgi:hypothetical protein